MSRLIFVFAGRTCHFVGFVMRRLICILSSIQLKTNEVERDFQLQLTTYLQSHNVSSKCQRDLLRVNVGLEQGEEWAQRMLDAFGKPGADLVDIRFTWIGSFDECIRVSYEEINENYNINGKYCWVNIPFEKSLAPDSSKYLVLREDVPAEFKVGTCFPSSCNEDDIKHVIRIVSKQIGGANENIMIGEEHTVHAFVECQTSTDLSTAAIVCLTIVGILAILLIAGTSYDVVVMRLKLSTKFGLEVNDAIGPQNEMELVCGNLTGSTTMIQSEASTLTEEEEVNINVNTNKNNTVSLGRGVDDDLSIIEPGEKLNRIKVNMAPKTNDSKSSQSKLHELCMAFSILKNGEEVFEIRKSKARIDAIEGIRVLTMSWIILMHMRLYNEHLTANFDLNVIEKLSSDWTILAIMHPGFMVDTFFALSGFLVAYWNLRKIKQAGSLRRFNWKLFYLFRFWRLSPTFYLVFLVYWKVIFGGFINGPLWANTNSPRSPAATCDKHWWKLFLYINNFDIQKQSCYQDAWYLAAELQMHFLSPLVLIPFYCFPKIGLKTLLHQGLSEPEFYGDLVYKFKKIVGRVDFSDQFRKIIVRYKRIGYNINIMRQSACLVFNPITVNNFASLFNRTPVGRASDSMMAPT